MKKHISELLNHSRTGHSNLEFVDINVLDDQKLFIDPCLIETQQGSWYNNATNLLDNFFNEFYQAYRNNDAHKKIELLSCAREINYTKLGYGNGDNGHGNTAEGLLETFKNLERLTANIPNITKAMDIPVTISGFSEDGLSDMITNILHFQLNEFTLEQLAIANVKPNSEDTFDTWDVASSAWKKVTLPCYRYENNKILLTPKNIVRKRYFFGANQFLMRVILERAKKETAYTTPKGKTRYRTTKKELKNAISKEDRNWRYKYINEKTESDQSFLKDYHDAIPYLYSNKAMTNEELDNFIYS
ncbi:hypothetical protein [Paenibacillus donghaensis]|uniref:Uncharacterized protein n=1 Tax=Paenibacillus donghaensis TaxID=414771 RepID=A0A2Z2KPP9_9BACL|nr:hypothetical protein [Paenibacillus donghaensis]ASA25693.1 hypothetical protein B9T62_36170 [Paenibacillus donghaensis]